MANANATVSRKINGVDKKFTPTENFIHQTGYRVKMIREQLKQLAKQHGTNYEYTPEMIDKTETELLSLIEIYLDALRDPKTATSDGYTFNCSAK